MNYLYWSVFLSLFLVSCQPHYTKDKTMLRAEPLLFTKPDSAQKLIVSIHHPEKLSKSDYAAWCLLYTYSQYKLYQDIKSDRIIRIAVNYYGKSKLYKQAGTAYYLWGCILESHQNNKEAMSAYKKADDLLSTTDEKDLKGLVDFEIGYIYMLDEVYGQSLIYY